MACDSCSREISLARKARVNENYESSALYPMMTSYPDTSRLKFFLSHSIPAAMTGVLERRSLFSVRICNQWRTENFPEFRRRMLRSEMSRE